MMQPACVYISVVCGHILTVGLSSWLGVWATNGVFVHLTCLWRLSPHHALTPREINL